MSSLASLLAGREGDFDDDVDVVYTSEVHTINGFTIKMPSAEHLALRKELAQKAKKRAANQKMSIARTGARIENPNQNRAPPSPFFRPRSRGSAVVASEPAAVAVSQEPDMAATRPLPIVDHELGAKTYRACLSHLFLQAH